jgi:hypothetical protein
MTPAEEVRLTCESLGEGGQSKLARLLPSRVPRKHVNSRSVRRWLAGKSVPNAEMLEQIRSIRLGVPAPPSPLSGVSSQACS